MNQQYAINQRSSKAPTTGQIKRTIQAFAAEGIPLLLIEMERKGYVIYNRYDGAYELTEEGRRFVAGGKQ